MRRVVDRVMRGLVFAAALVASSAAIPASPAAATQVGDTKLVQIDPYQYCEWVTLGCAADALQAYDGMYYDSGSGVYRAGVIEAAEWHGQSYQKWYMHIEEMYTSYWVVTFKSAWNNQCLDKYASNGPYDGRVWIYPCHSGDNQRWRIEKVADGSTADIFNIRNKWNGWYLDDDSSGRIYCDEWNWDPGYAERFAIRVIA